MVYNKIPHYVSEDTIEYGYYPQKEVDIAMEGIEKENELLVEGTPTGAFFHQDRFYYSYGGKCYEYLPIRWKIISRKEGVLNLISEDILAIDTYYGTKEFLKTGFKRTALFLDEGFLEAFDSPRDATDPSKRIGIPRYADCVKLLTRDRKHYEEAPLLVAEYPLAIYPEDYQKEEGKPLAYWVDDRLAKDLAECCVPLQKPSPLQCRKNCFEALGIRVCIAIKHKNVERGRSTPEKDAPGEEAIQSEFLLLEKDWKARSRFLVGHAQSMDPSFLEEAIRTSLPLFGEKDHRLIGAYALYSALRFCPRLSRKAMKMLAEELSPLRNGENMEHEPSESEEESIKKTVNIFREKMASYPFSKANAGLNERFERLLRYLSSQPDRHFHDRREWVKEEQEFALEVFTEVLLDVR